MWGHHIHEAVIANRESESGISIHFINEDIDGGEILFQAKCEVKPDDTPDSLATRIHALEHKFYPEVIEKLITSEVL
jgi:phosphoribosylglycinamide formyltransferase-1